jgi:hypothetical protein
VRQEGSFRDATLFTFKNDADSSDKDILDEYERYLQELLQEFSDSEPTLSALKYWKAVVPQYPNLTRIAMDALSIPAMLAECERCFSSSGNIIISNRNSLKPESIEANECQRH